MKRSSSMLLLFGTLLLGGCATLGKDECLTVDWRTVGYEDGVAGRAGDRIGEHRKACAKHGVPVDLGAYQSGRAEGLREFCQPHNGFRVGARGGAHPGACPSDLDAAFTEAWETGRQLYLLERRVAWVHDELEARRTEFDAIEDEIARLSLRVIGDGVSGEERAQALLDTRQLAERHGRIEAEIVELERERANSERELADYRSTLAWVG